MKSFSKPHLAFAALILMSHILLFWVTYKTIIEVEINVSTMYGLITNTLESQKFAIAIDAVEEGAKSPLKNLGVDSIPALQSAKASHESKVQSERKLVEATVNKLSNRTTLQMWMLPAASAVCYLLSIIGFLYVARQANRNARRPAQASELEAI